MTYFVNVKIKQYFANKSYQLLQAKFRLNLKKTGVDSVDWITQAQWRAQAYSLGVENGNEDLPNLNFMGTIDTPLDPLPHSYALVLELLCLIFFVF